MIRLDLASEPRWYDLGHGVRVLAAPMTSAMLLSARDDERVRELAEAASVGERSLVFCKAVARRVIRLTRPSRLTPSISQLTRSPTRMS